MRTILAIGLFLTFLFLHTSNIRAEEPTTENSHPNLEEIILVFKTHFDLGYTRLASEVVEQYRTAFADRTLELVDASRNLPQNRQFIWTVPGWPLMQMMTNQPPERAARMEEALRDGRFVVHALPFTLHVETLVEEDIVRGMRFASNINRALGKELPTDAKMTDVCCHSWFVPTLLAHSGITFMHEGTNSASKDPEVPILLFREGPDGSRVLTMHVSRYGTGIDPPADWSHKTWLGLIHTGDNQGPPRPDSIDGLFEQCREKYPGVKVRIGHLADFGNAILEKEDLSKIPVIRKDMPDTWIHGAMCNPAGQRVARRVHEELSYVEIFETLRAVAMKRELSSDVATKIADAREQSLLYGEHTWGGALSWICNHGQGENLPWGEAWDRILETGFNDRYKRLIQSWDEKSAYIYKADSILQELKDKHDGESYRFNPLPWELTDYAGNKIPPGGIVPAKTSQDANVSAPDHQGDITVSSSWFRIGIEGTTGNIKSIFDLKHNRELIAPTKDNAVGLLYNRADAEMVDRFLFDSTKAMPNWALAENGKRGLPRDVPELRAAPRSTESIEIQEDADGKTKTIVIRYRSEPDIPFKTMALSITLYEARPEIRLQFEGTGKKPDTWPEAGYFRFPLNITSPQFRQGRLGGIADPAKDFIRSSGQHFQWLRTGVAIFGADGYGVGICPLETPMISLDRPGGWLSSTEFIPKRANVFFNLFNNIWTTNFRLWNSDDVIASFVLWTFDKYDNESSLITPSLEVLALHCSTPMSLTEDEAAKWTRGITMNRKGIYVTAFGRDVDSGELMLRFWEMAGLGADAPEVEITLPPGMRVESVVPCDLRDRPIGPPIRVRDGKFTIPVKPYSPINLRVEGHPWN